jgi:hypothetical protein
MLAGAFGIPALLLWSGHRLRRRPPRWQGAFWGALIAHVIAVPIAAVAAMTPPAEWSVTDTMRGLFGLWLLLLAPLVGGAIGAAAGGRSRRA